MLSEPARLADLTLCELRGFEILVYWYTLRFQNPLRLVSAHVFAQIYAVGPERVHALRVRAIHEPWEAKENNLQGIDCGTNGLAHPG